MAFGSFGNDTTNWPNMPPTFQQGEIAEQFRDLDLWWEVQSNLGTSSQVVPSVLMTNLTTNVGWRNPCLKMPMTFREFQFSSISVKFNIDIRKWFYFERRSLSMNTVKLTICFLGHKSRWISADRFRFGGELDRKTWSSVCLNVRFKLITDFDVPFVQDVWKLFFGV